MATKIDEKVIGNGGGGGGGTSCLGVFGDLLFLEEKEEEEEEEDDEEDGIVVESTMRLTKIGVNGWNEIFEKIVINPLTISNT